MRIDLAPEQIEMILDGLILSAQAHEQANTAEDTAQAEDIRALADEMERMLAYLRDLATTEPLIY